MAIYCHALLQRQQDTACAATERKNTVAGLLKKAMKQSEWLFEAPRHTIIISSNEQARHGMRGHGAQTNGAMCMQKKMRHEMPIIFLLHAYCNLF